MSSTLQQNSQYARLAGLVGLDEKTFNLVNPFTLREKEGELVIRNYTLKKMGAKAEKSMLSAVVDEKSKTTVFDALLGMIIRVNDETRPELIKKYMKSLPACEIEAILYNFRVFNYGDDLAYPARCQGTINGEECGHVEDMDFDLTNFDVVREEIPEPQKYQLNENVVINMKRVLDSYLELDKLEKIPPKYQKKYTRELERMVMIESIDIIGGDEDDVNLPFGVDQLLNEKGAFVSTNSDVKAILQILGSISADDYSKMMELNKDVQEFSYYDLNGEMICPRCGHHNKFRVSTRAGHFLLQLGKTTGNPDDSDE